MGHVQEKVISCSLIYKADVLVGEQILSREGYEELGSFLFCVSTFL